MDDEGDSSDDDDGCYVGTAAVGTWTMRVIVVMMMVSLLYVRERE